MTRENYQIMAEILRTRLELADSAKQRKIVAEIANDMADAFKRDNPNFSYAQFFRACGLTVSGEL